MLYQANMAKKKDKNKGPRSCGECTACCQGWLKAQIYEHEMKPGQPCPHATDKGCGIYETRPELCRNFRCGWLIDSQHFPDWMRPDNSKVIVRFSAAEGVKYFNAFPVGATVPKRAENFLTKLSGDSSIPLVISRREKNEDGSFQPTLGVTGSIPRGMEYTKDIIMQSLKDCDTLR